MIIDDVVEIMISLPGKLFFNTQVPVCLWILNKDKKNNVKDRRKKILFIDGNSLGSLKTRALRILTDEDIRKIKYTVDSWRIGKTYKDEDGFCRSVDLEEISKNKYNLSP